MNFPNDKAQPSISATARSQMDSIQVQGGFSASMDVYRLAIAVALAEKLEPITSPGARETVYHVGTLDPDGVLITAIVETRPDHDDRPVALMERLAEAGLKRIFDHLQEGKSLRDFLDTYALVPQESSS
ncbi:MAG: hypothetical protein LC808_20670 [Actinobacteria bacterium]|nr:hypothetical protein [Actinomycetota bacterium]